MTKTRVPNAFQASDVPRPNYLPNAGLDIWQRGNGPFTINSGYSADRWITGLGGTDTLSVSKDTANVDALYGSQACASCNFVLGTGAGVTNLKQNLIPSDGYQLGNRTVSFSMRVRTNVGNAVRLAIYTGSGFIYGPYHSGSGVYETLSVASALDASPATPQFRAVFAATCQAYLDNAMLAISPSSVDYQPLTPADDLACCLRYYEELSNGIAGGILIQGYQSGVGQPITGLFSFLARKAIAPTVTIGGPWTMSNAQTTAPTLFNTSTDRLTLQITSAAAGTLYASNASGTASIKVEANP